MSYDATFLPPLETLSSHRLLCKVDILLFVVFSVKNLHVKDILSLPNLLFSQHTHADSLKLPYSAFSARRKLQNGTAFCPISNEKPTSISDPVLILDQIGPIFNSKHADVAERFGSTRLADRPHPPVHLCPALTTQT